LWNNAVNEQERRTVGAGFSGKIARSLGASTASGAEPRKSCLSMRIVQRMHEESNGRTPSSNQQRALTAIAPRDDEQEWQNDPSSTAGCFLAWRGASPIARTRSTVRVSTQYYRHAPMIVGTYSRSWDRRHAPGDGFAGSGFYL